MFTVSLPEQKRADFQWKSALLSWFSFQNTHQLSWGMFTSNAIKSFGVCTVPSFSS